MVVESEFRFWRVLSEIVDGEGDERWRGDWPGERSILKN